MIGAKEVLEVLTHKLAGNYIPDDREVVEAMLDVLLLDVSHKFTYKDRLILVIRLLEAYKKRIDDE